LRALARLKAIYFAALTLHHYVSIGSRSRLRAEAEVLVYLVEGKVFMESWSRLFGHVEALIRAQKRRLPIAAAVNVSIE